ncbi:MAG: uridine kinase [Euryarchaeota archaeon]|nr:uridine kinase [Euryarchaeota archaeon]|tara:strand:- start:333 stop:950 length:618 start_codon:yes stop_codon:yes gene_type:complete
MQNKSCKIIAIAGGSGAGKTTLAKKISKFFATDECEIISQDNYYLDLSDKFDYDGGSINFDHPEMLELDLLANHLELLKKNKSIKIPCYDFKTHSRTSKTKVIKPCEIILVDGTLILSSEKLSEIFDLKIFLNISENIRLERRTKRDIEERNRTFEGVINQWNKQVLPMHNKFVKTSLSSADIIISDNENINEVVKEILAMICRT